MKKLSSDWLKPSVHPAYLRLLCAHMRNKGFDVEDLFRGNSLDWQTLLSTQRFVNFDQFCLLAGRSMKLSDCPWLGLEISNIIQVSAHGPLGYGAVAANTVRDAFRLVERFMCTRISLFEFELFEEAGRAKFELRELIDSGDLQEFIYVMLLGSFQDLLAKTSGSLTTDLSVQFPFDAPAWTDIYEQRFPGLKISFGQKRFIIDMPLELLDWHCLTADEFAFRNAFRECEQLLAQHERGGELSEQIKKHLFHKGVPYPNQDEIARDRNMSVRTLIRKLKSEGTSYQSILDEVRKELACWHLHNSDMSIERIAELLGYQDTSNFSRVFRRWLGCTPSEFKEQQALK